ncbi:MAG: alanine racemase, partial [Tumebacillaceae bacterium]
MFIRPTWAEINLDNIAHNIEACRGALPPDMRLMAVVKANGYGHGAVAVAKKALEAGATYLAVATADEGIELRDQGIEAPILILGYTPLQHASLVVSYGLTQTVYQTEMLQALGEAAQRLDKTALIHVKVDTGMGRIGFTEIGETVAFLKKATQTPGVVVEGLFTHLATADELDSPYANEQMMRWQALLQACEEDGLLIPLVH